MTFQSVTVYIIERDLNFLFAAMMMQMGRTETQITDPKDSEFITQLGLEPRTSSLFAPTIRPR